MQVSNADAGNNINYSRQLCIMFNTFTGVHRVITEDPNLLKLQLQRKATKKQIQATRDK